MNKKLIKELEWSVDAPGIRPAHREKLQQALARAREEAQAVEAEREKRRRHWRW